MSSLEERIAGRSARVSVVGLGYVGLPLATRAKEAGYDVRGIDRYVDEGRLPGIEAAGVTVSRDFSPVASSDVVVICVPTPLKEGQQPDLSHVRQAASDVADNYGGGVEPKLVVLESTSYPGTTREVLLGRREKVCCCSR